MRQLFGTDGIRGKANVEPMTVETILTVAKAAATVLRKKNGRKHTVLIGKDTRVSGYMFETVLSSGLCSMGVDVYLVGPIPTPAVAFLTTAMRADAGAVISASHNPYYDNGLKFFGADGYKLSDDMELEIERLSRDSSKLLEFTPDSHDVGKAVRLDDARGRYITYLKYNFPREFSLKKFKIVLDCAQGATYKIAPSVFDELDADIVLSGAQPNGFNINEDCGALYPENLASKVKENNADIGIAFDGDGDRVLFVDHMGHVFDGDDILGILAPSLKKQHELGSGVVGTVMSNFGLENYFKKINIPFYRAQVGDRYVVEKMKEVGSLWGGEQSGHLVSLHRSTTGDGILSALLLLSELCRTNKSLSDFHGLVPRYPQVIRNVVVKRKTDLSTLKKVTASIEDAEKKLNGQGRVLVRYSGTELKARVMVEGENHDKVNLLADQIAQAVVQEIG